MTSDSKRLNKYGTDFGASVSRVLAEARMTQSQLAQATGQSVAYTNQIITGRKPAPQSWVELVADCLALPPEQKQELLTQAEDRKKLILPPYSKR